MFFQKSFSRLFSVQKHRVSFALFTSAPRSLKEQDPQVWEILEKERERQAKGLQLIASENFTSAAVREACSSYLMHKYSEGYPGSRYYAGNRFIDQNEILCQQRALSAFKLDPETWGVNVQPLSGSPANFAVYTALLRPHDRIMGLDLPHGGHLTHGYMSPKKRISATSIYFESMPYQLDISTGYIDYKALEHSVSLFRPNLIIAGASAYPRLYDYGKMRKIADINESYLLGDIAHTAGLVAAGVLPSPFDHCDVVTTTTHKTLRGPRGGLIFFRRGVRKSLKGGKQIMYDLEDKINFAVFPSLQGGPHNEKIAAISVALHEASQPSFKEYQIQVLKNAKKLAETLDKLKYVLVSGGTDNHLILLDLRPRDTDGARVDKVLEKSNIFCNRNAVPGDTKPFVPGGIRLGTPAMTSRGLKENHFEQIAEFLDRGIKITLDIQKSVQGTKLKDFEDDLNGKDRPEISRLQKEVQEFCDQFPMP